MACSHRQHGRDKTVLSCLPTADKTKQFCCISNCVNTTDIDKTKLSCLVHIGGVNTTAVKTRQFCLVRVDGVNKPLQTSPMVPCQISCL